MDIAAAGMCCEEFGFSFRYGVGRSTAMMRSSWIGSGVHVMPSTITMPALESEHILSGAGATVVTIQTVDYITNKRFVSLDFGYKNNIRTDSAYYIGAGKQNGYALRGRMRRGSPDVTASFVAEFVDGSVELSNMIAGTEGTLVFTVPGAVIGLGPDTHNITITLHRVGLRAVTIADEDGIVVARVDCIVMKHTSNGVVTIAVTTEQDDILTAAT